MKQILWISPDWGNTQGIGYKGNYANETAKWLGHAIPDLGSRKNYITKHSHANWTWKSQVDTDLETVTKMRITLRL